MRIHEQDAPPRKEMLIEKSIPADLHAKTPLIVFLVSKLHEMGLVCEEERERIEFCFEEALKNAIVHGNREQTQLRVRARVFRDDDQWGVEFTDEGAGFSEQAIADPDHPEFPWREHGRGIHVMALIADGVEFYRGGRSVVLTWDHDENPSTPARRLPSAETSPEAL